MAIRGGFLITSEAVVIRCWRGSVSPCRPWCHGISTLGTFFQSGNALLLYLVVVFWKMTTPTGVICFWQLRITKKRKNKTFNDPVLTSSVLPCHLQLIPFWMTPVFFFFFFYKISTRMHNPSLCSQQSWRGIPTVWFQPNEITSYLLSCLKFPFYYSFQMVLLFVLLTAER